MSLTDAERVKFAAWLERDAADSDGLADQMDKLPGGVMRMVAEKHRKEAIAASIVAARLKGGESFTVKG